MNKTGYCLVWLALCGLVSLSLAPTLQAAPEPNIVNRAWEFDFTHGQPQLIHVDTHEGQAHWFWYLPYKVVNNTDRERLFLPEFTVLTDEGHIVSANRGVPALVFEAIKQRESNPLLESPVKVIGRILLGEDHAKESVAVWPVFNKDVDEMTVFVEGISGETHVLEDPDTGEEQVLRKSLMLRYMLPGNPSHVQDTQLQFLNKRWVVR